MEQRTRNTKKGKLGDIGTIDPQYGGIITDINTLLPGTSFYVNNGAWSGKIVVENGKKYVHVGGVNKLALLDENKVNLLSLSNVKTEGSQNEERRILVCPESGKYYFVTVSVSVNAALSDAENEKNINAQLEAFVHANLTNVSTWSCA